MNIFEFAIRMELDGEKYYSDQAKINKGNSLSTVLLMLAKDEKNHADILQKKYNEASYEVIDQDLILEAKNVFKGAENFNTEVKTIPDQLDFYRMALDKEQESIQLYEKYYLEATDKETKDLFEYLVKQEKEHYEILDEIILLINKANEWVESAEFGVREEY
ncbi:MAG: rubrerythrin [Firmicutes bacterium HGW-Firmicutes-7]|nr:MAG: rubrerythrin [Firmicutes bacterium HGW-Firmicutes-7]